MQHKEEKRLSVGAIIEDRKSGDEYRVTAMNKHYIYYTGIKGLKVSGAIPKGAFHQDFTVLKEAWKKVGTT
ncbi:hypothetical protein ERX27_07555 [Macrococcus brunensis]|uniref:Uncharacterized protein n=1 Tax=Macrococcus brunensis TaxID=198483 RepID=A0A4R6BD35_9STAP|nr:hypothetical protein [Macrococcus brunensis]TDL96702.1 hypothetical protein ERX27_07555 [Macrococcus brunensis]